MDVSVGHRVRLGIRHAARPLVDGAELNITANCLDRHVAAGDGDRTAILWEPNNPADPTVSITYAERWTACAASPTCLRHGV